MADAENTQVTIQEARKTLGRKPRKDSVKLANAQTGEVYTKLTTVDKRWRDLWAYHLPVETIPEAGKVILIDPVKPLSDRVLEPGPKSPLCGQCKMDTLGARNPYTPYCGSDNPKITIITEIVTQNQDRAKTLLAPQCGATVIYQILAENAQVTGIDPDKDVRWVSITRCAVCGFKRPNIATKANWCRLHVVQDLMLHPPKLIMAFGSAALGALSYKSNAFDWQGKLLSYRGWPDDWLCDPKYVLPRDDMFKVEDGQIPRQTVGHPVFGPAPPDHQRTMLLPMQSPQNIQAQANHKLAQAWAKLIVEGAQLAHTEWKPLDYIKPWYRITTDPTVVADQMFYFIEHPGIEVAFDTETTGLKQFAKGQKVVFIMFRWNDPETGEPQSLGFPWDYPESELAPYIDELTPYVLEALYACWIAGHNVGFDALWPAATFKGCDINRLAPRIKWDTWHMAYTAKQMRGTLSLDRIVYDYAPDIAGYEEDMTLLIELHGDLLNPANGKGGHYAKCPKDKWDTHLKPYVMGDVEGCFQAKGKLLEKLESRPIYDIPLADPGNPGGPFRWFTPPSRAWVYENTMSPSNQTLIKMMARGMQIDKKKLKVFETYYPNEIVKLRDSLGTKFPDVGRWIADQSNRTREAGDEKTWEFDLEDKSVLKSLLFDFLQMPIQRLTPAGRDKYPTPEQVEAAPYKEKLELAAVDKFTLNKLAADYEIARDLLDYRKLYKLYTTYVRPMRNCYDERVDNKHRDKEPHLWFPNEDGTGGDGRLHASFMLTGTRGGRLSCRDPNLQQLPSDSEIKGMFVSRFGAEGCIYGGDLSQIELRLLAAACGDPNMLQAYYDDLDLHTLTTSRIFNKSYETYTKGHMEKLQQAGKGDEAKQLDLQRRIGKTCNFLTGYGGGAFGLQTTLANNKIYMQIEECQDILNSFFESYPTLRNYLGAYKEFVQETGVAVSILGRVRILDEVHSHDSEQSSKALRAGCNHLIQATASDMMLVCLNTIEQYMRAEDLRSILVSTVHDSLVIDAVRSELPKVHEIVDTVLNNIPAVLKLAFGDDYDTSWMIVPFAGDCEVGPDYKHVNKIPSKGAIDWDELLKA